MTQVYTERTQFRDELTDALLVNADCYFGQQNLDPKIVANRVSIYDNRALTGTPLANPIKTGTDGRTVSKVWISGKYSLVVDDSSAVNKLTDLDRGEVSQVGNTNLINAVGTNDITCNASPTITSYVDNQLYVVTAPGSNTGAMTITVDTLPQVSIVKPGAAALISGDIVSGQKMTMVYNESAGRMELTSATLNNTFTGNIQVGGDILDSNGNELVNFTATASAVNEVAIQNATTGNGPTIAPTGDDTNIDLNLAGQGTGVVKVPALSTSGGEVIDTKATLVSDHVRAGNTQIWTGENALTQFTVDTTVAASTWESIGPTGSGADNIWAQMDVIPSNAKILICRLALTVSPSGATLADVLALAVFGDDATPTGSFDRNGIGRIAFDPDANVGDMSATSEILIPLGATNQDFKVFWSTSNSDNQDVILYYKGFITD